MKDDSMMPWRMYVMKRWRGRHNASSTFVDIHFTDRQDVDKITELSTPDTINLASYSIYLRQAAGFLENYKVT
jgi:hypothetical protein